MFDNYFGGAEDEAENKKENTDIVDDPEQTEKKETDDKKENVDAVKKSDLDKLITKIDEVEKENKELKKSLENVQTVQNVQDKSFQAFSKYSHKFSTEGLVLLITFIFVIIIGFIDFLIVMSLRRKWRKTKPEGGCVLSAYKTNDINKGWMEQNLSSNIQQAIKGKSASDRAKGVMNVLTEDTGLKDKIDDAKQKIKNKITSAINK